MCWIIDALTHRTGNLWLGCSVGFCETARGAWHRKAQKKQAKPLHVWSNSSSKPVLPYIPKPFQNQAKISPQISQTPSKTFPNSFPNPPQTFPKPFKREPKSIQKASWKSNQNASKSGQKRAQSIQNPSQMNPKTSPKSSFWGNFMPFIFLFTWCIDFGWIFHWSVKAQTFQNSNFLVEKRWFL